LDAFVDPEKIFVSKCESSGFHLLEVCIDPAGLHDARIRMTVNALQNMTDFVHQNVRQNMQWPKNLLSPVLAILTACASPVAVMGVDDPPVLKPAVSDAAPSNSAQ
jgi:hypothetical protein